MVRHFRSTDFLYRLINHDLQLILDRETIHLYSSHSIAKGDCGSAALGRYVKLSKRFVNRAKNLTGLLYRKEGAMKAAIGGGLHASGG